ncbi:MAG: alpha/beta hydrolase, partial [Parcubacteria group bacterium]|nr:alpha/beta hydrolase [Parcubacteria group bacterium]
LQVRRAHIAERCGVDENTYFVGHSIGCQAIIRFLDTFDGNQKIGGAVFVGGWLPPLLKGITDKEKKLARPWLETPIDFRKVKKIINQCVAIFSDNDYYVPLANQDIFKKELGAEIIIEHQRGHLGGADGITELPSARGALLKIIEKS